MSASPYSSGPSRKSRLRQRSGVQPGISLPGATAPENDAAEKLAGQQDPADPAALEDKPSTVARPRQPTVNANYGYASPPKHRLRRALIAGAFVGCGVAAGYFIGVSAQSSVQTKKPTRAFETIETVDKPPRLTEEERTQFDTAFRDGRARQYKESEQIFNALAQKHPSLTKIPLEIARMDIYRQDYTAAQKILSGLMLGDSDARPDAFFLSGVLDLKAGAYQDAEACFAAATDADPTHSEYFYFWGDCLRQEGKAQEAGTRFRSALERNQYETAEDLLQLKVWLCDITLDQEKTSGADAAINDALAKPYPRAAALLAAAARAMKANRFAEAAGFITRGRGATEQTVFNIVMHDPTFFQESWRPELAPFYAEPGAPQPMAGRPATATPAPSVPAAALAAPPAAAPQH